MPGGTNEQLSSDQLDFLAKHLDLKKIYVLVGEPDGPFSELSDSQRAGLVAKGRALLEEESRTDPEAAQKRLKVVEFLTNDRASIQLLKNQALAGLGTLTASMTQAFADVETALDQLAANTDVAEIERQIAIQDAAFDKLKAEVERLTALRTTFLSAVRDGKQTLVVLNDHTGKDAVSSDIGAQTTALTDLVRETEANKKYEQGATAVAAILAELEKITTKADDIAHYQAILADRQARVAAIVNPAAHSDAAEAVTKVSEHLAAAIADADTGKYADALVKLDAIPKMCIDTNWLCASAKEYETLSLETAKHKEDLNTIIDGGGPQKPEAEKCLAMYDGAVYRKADGFETTVIKLKNAHKYASQLYWEDMSNWSAGNDLKKLKEKIAAFKGHSGKDAIEADITRLEGDAAFMQTLMDEIPRDPAAVCAIFGAAEKTWPTVQKHADHFAG